MWGEDESTCESAVAAFFTGKDRAGYTHPAEATNRSRSADGGRAHPHCSGPLKGAKIWNGWRDHNPQVTPDLRVAQLSKKNLDGYNLRSANLYRTSLWKSSLCDADLTEADLSSVNLNGTILKSANLERANLRFSRLVGADVTEAIFSGSFVYGCSAWNLIGSAKAQNDLVITPPSETPITVDSIEVAQFVYLLLGNPKIRSVIDTLATRAILILGRFTPDRKAVLEVIRNELRECGYVPILFDFEVPTLRDVHETVLTLASLVRFIIADISDPRSIPQELAAIVPTRPSTVVVPLLQAGFEPWSMFEYIQRFPWVLPVKEYVNVSTLMNKFKRGVLQPAEAKVAEQTARPQMPIERLG